MVRGWTAGFAVVLILKVVSAAAASLAPHRAAYELDLVPGPQSDLVALEGALVIEWEATCELWLSHQRMAFVATQRGGETFRQDVRYSSVEALGGSSLRFTVRTYDGETLVEEYRGEARAQAGGGTVATFRSPAPKRLDLPVGTTFPTAHLVDVLQRADAGDRLVTHQVFDGWGYDALTQVTTVIGEPQIRTPDQGDPATSAWPTSMAYYEQGDDEVGDVPSFEATFLLSSSGVFHDLELHYGDFAVSARLSEVELRERPDC